MFALVSLYNGVERLYTEQRESLARGVVHREPGGCAPRPWTTRSRSRRPPSGSLGSNSPPTGWPSSKSTRPAGSSHDARMRERARRSPWTSTRSPPTSPPRTPPGARAAGPGPRRRADGAAASRARRRRHPDLSRRPHLRRRRAGRRRRRRGTARASGRRRRPPSSRRASPRAWTEVRRARADEALRSSEERFRTIVTTANEGISMMGQRRQDHLRQRRARRVARLQRRRTRRQAAGRAERGRGRRPGGGRVARRASEGRAGRYDLRLKTKDGEPIWFLISAAPIYDANGDVVGRGRDVHRHRRAQAAGGRARPAGAPAGQRPRRHLRASTRRTGSPTGTRRRRSSSAGPARKRSDGPARTC